MTEFTDEVVQFCAVFQVFSQKYRDLLYQPNRCVGYVFGVRRILPAKYKHHQENRDVLKPSFELSAQCYHLFINVLKPYIIISKSICFVK